MRPLAAVTVLMATNAAATISESAVCGNSTTILPGMCFHNPHSVMSTARGTTAASCCAGCTATAGCAAWVFWIEQGATQHSVRFGLEHHSPRNSLLHSPTHCARSRTPEPPPTHTHTHAPPDTPPAVLTVAHIATSTFPPNFTHGGAPDHAALASAGSTRP